MATTENPVGIEVRAPMLAALDGPAALRELSHEQLTHLAEEIRTVVIDTVDRNGGHLGSNLGAVELTIALHRAFDSPRDLLLFDTGHQTYPHKLLTGRLPRFDSLRTPGGLSGYPAREESEHDLVENSHASTILSWAHGLATARRLRGDEGHVVAVIGDGSLTGGMAWEGLNNLGASGTDCLVIVNDNGRSYAPTVSRLGEGLARSDTGAELFGCLGLTYLGSVDGHDLHALDAALRVATTRRGPRVLHVRTEKGRGHQPALDDPIKRMHDTSVTRPDSYTASFGRAIVELGAADPRVVALTAAMPDSTGLLEFAEQFPDRCFDVGIAEQHAVTMAAGLAMGGLVPVVAIYSTFLTRALDQVVYDVGLHDLGVIFCLDRAGITGDDGASHHGVLDLALLSRIPGMTILTPSCLADLPEMLRYAHQVATAPNPGPVAIRWSKTVPTTGTVRSLGTSPARVVREGSDVCLVAVGKCVDAATDAAERLARMGIDATVWDVRRARPLDPDLLVDAASHRCVLTIEDGIREGGVGAALADALGELTLGTVDPPRVRVLGTPVAYLAHDKPDALLARIGLGVHGIVDEAAALVRAGQPTTTPTTHSLRGAAPFTIGAAR